MKPFDEIVFEKRNKEYGSYVLRKKYGKHLMISMIIGLFAFIVLIGSTVVAINRISTTKEYNKDINVEILAAPKEDMPAPPPPPPAELKMPKFVAPTIVDEENVDNTMGTQDDLSTRPTAPPTNDNDIVVAPQETPSVIEEPKVAEIFTVVEEQPIFNGDLYNYLASSIKYPEEAKELNIQGKVYVTFVVEKNGSITNVKVLRGIGGGCDEEAIRVVKAMPNWTPGKQRGNAVRVQFNLPISFKLLN